MRTLVALGFTFLLLTLESVHQKVLLLLLVIITIVATKNLVFSTDSLAFK